MVGEDSIIYKIADNAEWAKARENGQFDGAEIDIADGFIHFSTAEQAVSTLEKHFVGRTNLLLVAVDADALRGKIVYEEARGGQMFPHLYEPLMMEHVLWEAPIETADDGSHTMPERFEA